MSDLFEQYPNMSEYYETSDGVTFYKEDPAKVHARTLKDQTVKTVKRSDVEASEESKTETAKEILLKIPDMDLDTLQLYLDSEDELEKPRKSVTDALEKRIADLQSGK